MNFVNTARTSDFLFKGYVQVYLVKWSRKWHSIETINKQNGDVSTSVKTISSACFDCKLEVEKDNLCVLLIEQAMHDWESNTFEEIGKQIVKQNFEE